MDKEEYTESQKKIIKLLSKHITPQLLKTTWGNEGQKILMNRDKFTLNQNEKNILKYLITIGTPEIYREKLWLLCSGAKANIVQNPNYYTNLLKLSQEVPSLYHKQILKDIPRTKSTIFDSHPEFKTMLQNVLICYSIRNSSIGYCQGFNFIVLRLIEVLKNEENAFWVFCNLIEEILPLNYYTEMCGIIVDMTIITSFVKKYYPKLRPVLEEKEENAGDYIGKNLINQGLTNIFLNNMVTEGASLLIWDYLFLEGNTVLIKTFLALYYCIRKPLLTCKRDVEHFQMVITNDLRNVNNDNVEFITNLIIKQYEFTEDYLDQVRFNLSQKIEDSFENDNIETVKSRIKAVNKNYTSLNFKSCNKNWPYCTNDYYFENVNQIVKYTTMNPKYIEHFCDDYFFEGLKRRIVYKKEYKKSKEISDPYLLQSKKDKETIPEHYNLIMERRLHYCSETNDNPENNDEKIEDSVENSNEKIDENLEEKIQKETINTITNLPGFVNAALKELDKFKPVPLQDEQKEK